MGLSHTVSGDIASFRTPSRVPIESLKFHFLPKQAAGTPTPENPIPIEGWTGLNGRRAGKNMWHITAYSTQNSINNQYPQLRNDYGTEINTTDASVDELVVTQSQWPNAQTFSHYSNGYISIWNDSLVFGQHYDVSFKVEVTNNPLNSSLYGMILLAPNGSTCQPSKIIDGNILIFKNINYKPYIQSGVEKRGRKAFELRICGMSLKLSKFMVTPANTSDGVFKPYSGEQISITFPSNGKNLYDISTYPLSQGYVLWPGNGTADSGYPNYATTLGFIPCENIAGRTVTLNRRPGDGNPGFAFYKEANISSRFAGAYNTSGTAGTPWTIEVPKEAKYMRFSVPANTYDIQIELGDTSTAYEPYSSDNTFYGGYVDPIAGEIVATHKKFVLTGYENISYSIYEGSIYTPYSKKDILADSKNGTIIYGWSNMFKQTSGNLWTYYIRKSYDEYGLQFYNVKSYFNLNELTIENFVAKLKSLNDSGNPLTIVYELATPIHIPISAQDLKAFLDHNNFWSDTNDVTEVTYAVTESKDIFDARKLIMDGSQPHLENASGTIASFSTDIKAPVKELKAYFTPVQDGSGNPSSENVRPIHGWTGIDLFETGVNLFSIDVPEKNPDVISYSDSSKRIFTPFTYCKGASYSNYFNKDNVTTFVKNENGFQLLSRAGYGVGFAFPLKAGATYRFRFTRTNGGIVDVAFYAKDGTYLGYQNSVENTAVTVPSNAEISVFVFRSTSADSTATLSNLYLCKDGDMSSYEDHSNELVFPIKFPAMKNLLNIEDTYYINPGVSGSTITIANGVISIDAISGSARTYVVFNKIFQAGTYTIQAKNSGAASSAKLLADVEFDGSTFNSYYNMYTKQISTSTYTLTFTLPSASKIGLVMPNASGESGNPGSLYDIQVEFGSVATACEPFGVAYGGYADIIRGKFIVEYKTHVFNGSERIDEYPGTFTNGIRLTSNALDDCTSLGNTTISDKAVLETIVPSEISRLGIRIGGGAFRFYFYIPDSMFDGGASTEKFKQWLAENKLTVVARLTTPIEYDLTPQQIKTLKGINNIWSNANGAIDIKYWTH